MNKRTIVISLILTTILVAIGISWAGVNRKEKNLVWRPPQKQQKADQDDNRTLKEKAREARNYVKTENPTNLQNFTSLKDLAKTADVVVIGTVKNNISKLSADEKGITIDYNLVVEKVYRGKLSEGNEFTVSLPGGKVVFPDGSTATVSTPWFKKMQNDKTYLLFLKQGETFTTVGGPRGVFQIPTDRSSRKVQAHTLIAGDPILEYDDIDVRAFFKELRLAIPKEKSNQ
jgi:hypothetical protein